MIHPIQQQFALFPQRWRERRPRYRPAGEPIDTRRYGVDVIEEALAKSFVLRHHYSGSMPSTRVSIGLFESGGCSLAQLVGVAVFSVPVTNFSFPKHLGLPAPQGVDLGRFVLLDTVAGNGESWFLGQAFRVLRVALPEVRGVLAYSDPMPRVMPDRHVVKRGHVGQIYVSHNGQYFSRTKPRAIILTRSGHELSPRTLSKLRNGERGADGAYRQLLAHGAPRRRIGENDRGYVERALREGPFARVRHLGMHVFGWPIGGQLERSRLRRQFAPSRPYPRHADAPIVLSI